MKKMLWLFLITALLGQFKSDAQKAIEQTLMAPCCGGGTLAEHDDNQHTFNMKRILAALTADEFDAEHIRNLFNETYSNNGIYRLHFAPAIHPLAEIKSHLEEVLHPQMTQAEIIDLFAWIHGDVIMSAPRSGGFQGFMAWRTPLLILFIGLIIILTILRVMIRRSVAETADGPERQSRPDSSLEQKIAQEMEKLNL